MSVPVVRRRTAPTALVASFWLWIASAAISLLAFFLTLAGLVTGPAAEGGVGGGLIALSVAGALIGAAVRVVCAIFLLRGANWARIILSVVAGLLLVSLLPVLIAGDIVSVVIFLMAVVAAVLMWLPSTRPHFRRPRA